jgi:hypothetical protein
LVLWPAGIIFSRTARTWKNPNAALLCMTQIVIAEKKAWQER